MSEWQPIETAPVEKHEWIMLGHKNFTIPEIGFFNKKHDVWCSDNGDILFSKLTPTHWMPLPQPPKEQR